MRRTGGLVDKQVVGERIEESEGVYIVGELGQGPEDWSEEKTRNETDLIRTTAIRSALSSSSGVLPRCLRQSFADR